ncbi:MAG: ATP-binding protein [Lachnospiraceae bacterium]
MANFKDVVGQEHIISHMQKAIESQRVSHAYIIQGEKKSGKLFIAKNFAKTLQCEKGDSISCDLCKSCIQTESNNHPDIIYITHEKPNTISVDDIRNQLNNSIDIKPYNNRKKIYIIEDGEKLTIQAQNAILKTIEEPPSYGIVMILTNNVDMLLPTILSRCILLNMKPLEDEVIKNYLCKQLEIPDYKAKVCAAFSRGNLGKAMILAKSEEFDLIKGELVSLLKYIKEMELSEIVLAIKQINEMNFNIPDYLDMLAIWYRDILLFKATKDVNHLIFKEEIQYIKKVADNSSYDGIECILKALDKAKVRINANINIDLVLELLLLTIKEN